MSKPRGRKPKEVDGSLRNKMVTIRLSGEKYNLLCKAARTEGKSMNEFITHLISNHESKAIARTIESVQKDCEQYL